jgi:glycosyltransferase involved in cell wall biosynthesis
MATCHEPDATVLIVSRNRRDELRRALQSAVEQRGTVEVLVIDDASDDGTSDMVRAEFPDVRVERFEVREGSAARRNDAASLARGRIMVSIDDDALFSSRSVVAQTLRDFDADCVGVVAIPYIDVRIGAREHQRAPDPDGRWLTATFVGTAHAMRRDVFYRIGGYRRDLSQGEESELALRLLDAGYFVRLGRADPIHHFLSQSRDVRLMDVNGRRNEIVWAWSAFPSPWHIIYVLGYLAKGVLYGLRVRRPLSMAQGMAMGLTTVFRARGARRPVSRRAFRLDRRLRRRRALPIDRIDLPRSAAAGDKPAHPDGASVPS